MGMNEGMYLLAIRGSLRPKTQEESRTVHNMTAGNPQGVAAARSLGDLSHNVYVSMTDIAGSAGELLILDLWNNLDGFGKFFADKQVQEGGNMIFASVENRELWVPAYDFQSFTLPTPPSKTDRFVGLLHATVRSRESAKIAFGEYAKTINAARLEGQVSHEIFFRMSDPGQPPSLEVLGVDVWMDAEGMGRFYADPKHLAPLGSIFTGPPQTSTWKRPAGSWVEW
jgi:hypothetical protein